MAFDVKNVGNLLERSSTLRRIRIDDWVFGMSAISDDGYESPVASAVPGGAWQPLPPAPKAQP